MSKQKKNKHLEENSKHVMGILNTYMELDEALNKLGVSNDISVELDITALTPYGVLLVKALGAVQESLQKEDIMAKKEIQTAKVLGNPVKKTKSLPKQSKPKSGK